MSRARRLLATASTVAGSVPPAVGWRAAHGVGRLDGLARRRRYGDLAANLEAVGADVDRSAGVASYARYWFESFALPSLDDAQLDRAFSFRHYDRILRAQRAGAGPILVLPHLGGWEWAAAWLARIDDAPVTAVAEHLADEDAFEWFVELRSSYGVEVLAHDDPATTATILRRVDEGRIVCLLADRAVGGDGVPVEFFGRPAVVPGGPALLALRSGATLLPTVVYFRGHDRWTVIGEPVAVERRGRLRADVARITQDVVGRLEDLIEAAPAQWHVLAPFWNDDEPAAPVG